MMAQAVHDLPLSMSKSSQGIKILEGIVPMMDEIVGNS